jgi:hypothetical protein
MKIATVRDLIIEARLKPGLAPDEAMELIMSMVVIRPPCPQCSGAPEAYEMRERRRCPVCSGTGSAPGPHAAVMRRNFEAAKSEILDRASLGIHDSDVAGARILLTPERLDMLAGEAVCAIASRMFGPTMLVRMTFAPGDWPEGATSKLVRQVGSLRLKDPETGAETSVMTYAFAPSVRRVAIVETTGE